jgi:hypothetical protein
VGLGWLRRIFTTGVIVRLVSSALSTVGESWSDGQHVLDRLTMRGDSHWDDDAGRDACWRSSAEVKVRAGNASTSARGWDTAERRNSAS